MLPDWWSRAMVLDPTLVESILVNALARRPGAEREGYLQSACEGRPGLRERVEELLAADGEIAGRDPPPASIGSTSTTGVHEPPSPRVVGPAVDDVVAGRYKLKQLLGEGGMGTVYLAEQLQPVRRKVAVKLIKPGMDSRQILGRFEHERQALARMNHPNIAKVLDAGTTELGHPFFVMEAVNGDPLTKFCDERHLGVRERLSVFVEICNAVQHAHQKGIVHRDLKPGNILVESHDGRPVPKVIDFGLAKAMNSDSLSDHSFFTMFGAAMGTPTYMAPEQAEVSAIDVDTRADVYALGVILYELLTGSTPLEKKRLAAAAWDEVRRVIREEEPPKPSVRLSTTAALPSVAASRGVEVARLGKLVRGDLDWIAMKALAKERDRRYQTPSAFAADVERYLNDEPVSAGPPGARYRARKFIRRYRGRVAASLLVLGAVVFGAVAATYGMIRARNEREIALRALEEADSARRREVERAEEEAQQRRRAERAEADARASVRLAQTQLETANAISSFLTADVLSQAGSTAQAEVNRTPNPNLTVAEALESAAAAVGEKFRDRPELEAYIRRTIGNAYGEVGRFRLAVEELQRSAAIAERQFQNNDVRTIGTLSDLGAAYKAAGMPNEAVALYEKLLSREPDPKPADSQVVRSARANLAGCYEDAGRLQEAVALFEKLREAEVSRVGPKHRSTLLMMGNLARVYQACGRNNEALALLERVRDDQTTLLGPEHPSTLTTLTNLCWAYRYAARLPEALALAERVRDARVKQDGPEHPKTLVSMAHVASVYQAMNRVPEAVALLDRVRDGQLKKLGQGHPDLLTTQVNLALVYQTAGRAAESAALLESVAAERERLSGPMHPESLAAKFALAGAWRLMGRTSDAVPLYEKVLELQSKKFGAESPKTIPTVAGLAAALWMAGSLDRSIPLFEKSLRMHQKQFGEGHPETLRAMANLGVNYRDAGRLPEAIPLLEQVRSRSRGAPSMLWAEEALVEAYLRADRRREAAELTTSMLNSARRRSPTGGVSLANALATGGGAYLRNGMWKEAEEALREANRIATGLAPDSWLAFHIRSMLGESLSELGRKSEAETLLKEGFEGLRPRAAQMPASIRAERLASAAERLMRFAEAAGDSKGVERWKAERAKAAK